MVFGYAQLELRGLVTGSWKAVPSWISLSAGEMLPWLRTLPPDAVMAAEFETLFRLHTGRTSAPFSLSGCRGRHVRGPTPAEQRAYHERQGATYVLISGSRSLPAPELRALTAAY